MPVFNMYMKMWKAKLRMITLYTIMFLGIFALFTNYYSNTTTQVDQFASNKIKFALHDYDHSTLSNALYAYLVEYNEEVTIKMEEEAIKDALFYQEIGYYIEIPQGFEASFITQNKQALITKQLPNDASAYQMASQINSVLSKYEAYHALHPQMQPAELIQQVQTALAQSTQVHIQNSKNVEDATIVRAKFFNYMAYIFFAIIMMSCSLILIRIFHNEVRKRQLVAPITNFSFNLQLAAGSIIGAIIIWAAFMAAVQLLNGNLFRDGGIYYMINSLLFLIVCMSIAFLCANLLAGKRYADEALNGITTFAGLGMCFLGGVFLPQYLLGEPIQLMGSCLPTFWYVKANELLINIHVYSFANMKEVYFSYGIQLLFALVFFALAIYVAKVKASAHDIS